MYIFCINRYRIPNKYFNKVKNPQTVPIDRIKLRKEYKLKVEQNKQQM